MRNLIHFWQQNIKLIQITSLVLSLLFVVLVVALQSTKATTNVVSVHHTHYQTSKNALGTVDADWRVQFVYATDSVADDADSTWRYAILSNDSDACAGTTSGFKAYNEKTPLKIDDLDLNGTPNARPANICFEVRANSTTTYKKSRLKDSQGTDIKMCAAQFKSGNNGSGQCMERLDNNGLIVYPSSDMITANYQDADTASDFYLKTYDLGFLADGTFNRFYDACGKANFPIKQTDTRLIGNNITSGSVTFRSGDYTLQSADSGQVACLMTMAADNNYYYARTAMIEIPSARSVTTKFVNGRLEAKANFFIKNKDSWKYKAQADATSCSGSTTGFSTIPVDNFNAVFSKQIDFAIPANAVGKYICVAAQGWFANSYVFTSQPLLLSAPNQPTISQQGSTISTTIDGVVTSQEYKLLPANSVCNETNYGTGDGKAVTNQSVTLPNTATDLQVFCLKSSNAANLSVYTGLVLDLSPPAVAVSQVDDNTAIQAQYTPATETLAAFKYAKLTTAQTCTSTILDGASDYAYAKTQANNPKIAISKDDHGVVYCFWAQDAIGNVGHASHSVTTRDTAIEVAADLTKGSSTARLVNASGTDISSRVTDWRYTIFNKTGDCDVQIYYDINTPGQIVGNSNIVKYSSGHNGMKYCFQATISENGAIKLIYSSVQTISGVPNSVPPTNFEVTAPTPQDKTILISSNDPSASIWYYKVIDQAPCNATNYNQSTAVPVNYILAYSAIGKSLMAQDADQGKTYCFQINNTFGALAYVGVPINVVTPQITASQGYFAPTQVSYITAQDSTDATGSWARLVVDPGQSCPQAVPTHSVSYSAGDQIILGDSNAHDSIFCFWKTISADQVVSTQVVVDLLGPGINFTKDEQKISATSPDQSAAGWQLLVLASELNCDDSANFVAARNYVPGSEEMVAEDNNGLFCFRARDEFGNYTYAGATMTYEAPTPTPDPDPTPTPDPDPGSDPDPDPDPTPTPDPDPDPGNNEPDSTNQPETIGIAFEQVNNELIASLSDGGETGVYEWSWVVTSSDQCDEQTDFESGSKRGVGNIALLEESDGGLWYCFRAQNSDGLSGYGQYYIVEDNQPVEPIDPVVPTQPSSPTTPTPDPASDPEDEGSSTLWIVLGVIGGLVVIGLILTMVLKKGGGKSGGSSSNSLPEEPPEVPQMPPSDLGQRISIDTESPNEPLAGGPGVL